MFNPFPILPYTLEVYHIMTWTICHIAENHIAFFVEHVSFGAIMLYFNAMKTNILLISNLETWNATLWCDGVNRHAQQANWRITVADRHCLPPVQTLIRSLRIDGVISDGYSRKTADAVSIAPSNFGNTPVVYVNCNPNLFDVPIFCVVHDSFDTGRIAAKELFNTGLKNFAYVPRSRTAFWDGPRLEGFRQKLAELDAAKEENDVRVFHYEAEYDALWRNKLSEWLIALPKPVGVFAANDQVAYNLLLVAKQAGVEVPNEVAVVGVDNNPSFCTTTNPGITSIDPDFKNAGVLAARLLSERLADPQMQPKTRWFGAVSVERRASTDRMACGDTSVARVLSRIRATACEGLKAKDAVAAANGSRSYIERRFKTATGHSILHEINLVRIENAKRLLRETAIDITAIANFCGWSSYGQFHRMFRKFCSVSPSAYRLSAT